MVHVDQLILDPCHQDRANWVRDQLARQIEEWVIYVGTDPLAPMIIARRSFSQRRKPSHFIYYLQI